VPVRFLSDAQREQLSGFPAEVDDEVLDRLFTLSGADLVEARRRRGEGNRLGWSLLLCGLRMLGFCPDDVTTAPPVAVRFVARQLGVDPAVLAGYGQRAQTRTDHVNQVKAYLGFRSPTAADLVEVRDWLAAEALVQDRPVVLFRLACERLHELRVVRPGLTVIEQSLVGGAREAARRETAARVAGLCTPERCRLLDGLLRVDPDLGVARASWLRRFAVAACPRDLLEEMDKLVFLRELGAGDWDLGVLPAQRVAALARWVQAASNQALAQSSPQRRYPALLAFAVLRVVELTDELVDLFDKLLGDINAKARKRLGDYQQSIAAAANDKVLLLAEIARVLLDPDLDDDNRLAALFAAVPKDRLAAALADCERIARPADNSHIDLLGDHYSKLRQCVPRLLEVLTFCSHRDAGELLAGIEVLRELNRTGRRKVPRDAPLTFVPKAWMPFVACGPDTVSRRFWELALLWRLRDGLRSGDVWVQDSRRYADPETYLLDRDRWDGMRSDYCSAVGRPRSGRERVAQLGRELDEELASFAGMLTRGEGPVRLDGDRLVVGRDTGDDPPASVKGFKSLLGEVFPQVELAEVVIAIDSACGFSKHLLHAGGAKHRSPAMLIHLYAAILAQATNLGPVAMARASGLSYDQVAHATAWYLREETLTPAIDEVINYHHRLPAARAWGDGTFASSDGQRFPVQVKAANAGALPRYFGFGRGLSVLTSVTDHYATFGTKVIPTRVREGLHALDEIFALRERDSELRIAEHTTDTAGFTDLLFGAYDVVGLFFCPRIRDLADQRLWLPAQSTPPKLVAPLVANRVTLDPILACWDDLLRLGASIHEGEVLPSLLLTKLQAFPRQNALARALQDYGRLVKTLFILRYLQRPEMRKRVGRQLNKGENLNGLREAVYFAHLGQIRHRQLIDQTAQALCITLVVNCIAAFNAGLLHPAVHRLRAAGFEIDDADVAHAGPTMSEHILVHGRYHYDLNRPPKQLRPAPIPARESARGLRPATEPEQ
jgi:TnpA family transposase